MNELYGTRVAVLAGDFLFAQSSWGLANLDNLEVIKLISQVRALASLTFCGGARCGVQLLVLEGTCLPWGMSGAACHVLCV